MTLETKIFHEEKIKEIMNTIKTSDYLITANMETLLMDDKNLALHSENVGFLSGVIGSVIGLNNTELVTLIKAGLMHDFGKTMIPKSILHKKGRLNDNERLIINKHPLYGYTLLEKQNFDMDVLQVALQHHEKIDGRGYPSNKRDIGLFSKIITISDIFDALTSKRPYNKQFSKKKAMNTILEKEKGLDKHLCLTLAEYLKTDSL